MKRFKKKTCKDCPFKKTSVKGWLGGQHVDNKGTKSEELNMEID